MRFLEFKHVSEMVGLKRTAIYELIREGKFPPSIDATPNSKGNSVRWVSDEVEDWMRQRIKDFRNGEKKCL